MPDSLTSAGMYGTTCAPPMDKAFYLDQLRSMKALGFNFIRFHTHLMPAELFEAADELGFLCDPEFAMSYAYPTDFGAATFDNLCAHLCLVIGAERRRERRKRREMRVRGGR